MVADMRAAALGVGLLVAALGSCVLFNGRLSPRGIRMVTSPSVPDGDESWDVVDANTTPTYLERVGVLPLPHAKPRVQEIGVSGLRQHDFGGKSPPVFCAKTPWGNTVVLHGAVAWQPQPGNTVGISFLDKSVDLVQARRDFNRCNGSWMFEAFFQRHSRFENFCRGKLQKGTLTKLYSRRNGYNHYHAIFHPHGLLHLASEFRYEADAIARQSSRTQRPEYIDAHILSDTMRVRAKGIKYYNSTLARYFYNAVLGFVPEPSVVHKAVCSEWLSAGRAPTLDLTDFRRVNDDEVRAPPAPTRHAVQQLSEDILTTMRRQYGDYGTNETHPLLYERRQRCFELVDQGSWGGRIRGVRPEIENSILSFYTARGVGARVTTSLGSMPIGEQYAQVRMSSVVLLSEGAGSVNMLLARPGSTWIMVHDHTRQDNSRQALGFHRQIAASFDTVRMIYIVVYKHIAPDLAPLLDLLRGPWKPGNYWVGAKPNGWPSNETRERANNMYGSKVSVLAEAWRYAGNRSCYNDGGRVELILQAHGTDRTR